jgi:uracil-DNA glycosylase
MAPTPSHDSVLAAQSFVDWWKMAGVEYLAGDQSVNWLEEAPAPVERIQAKVAPPAKIAPAPAIAPPAPRPATDWPATLENLRDALRSGESLPGNRYSAARALPNGAASAAYMIISDYPEDSEIAAGEIGTIPLLKNMLRAANIAAETCYFASLASTRPASDAFREADKALLGEFMRHQIGLVAPQRLVLLGSNATEILLGVKMVEARGELRFINHDVGKMAALATFHPRTLIKQPIFKAKAWQDLQMIMQENSA